MRIKNGSFYDGQNGYCIGTRRKMPHTAPRTRASIEALKNDKEAYKQLEAQQSHMSVKYKAVPVQETLPKITPS